MRRAALLLGAALLLASPVLAPIQAAQQRPEWLRQYSWEQVRALNARIAQFFKRDRVKSRTLDAIAEAVGMSKPNQKFEKLIEMLDAKSREAAELKANIERLKLQLRALPNPAVRDPAEVALARATAAFDEGRFDEAEVQFRKLSPLRMAQVEGGFAAWSRAMDALIAINKLRLRYDEATALARQKADYALSVGDESITVAWNALIEAANIQILKAESTGGIDGLNVAKSIYTNDMVELLRKHPDWSREYARKILYAQVLSRIALRGNGIEGYAEPNQILLKYIKYGRDTKCDPCVIAGLSTLSYNTASIIFRSRDAKYLEVIEQDLKYLGV